MGEHVPDVCTRGSKKLRSSKKVLKPQYTDEEFDLLQVDTGKHSGDISDPIGGTLTLESEHTVVEEEDQALNCGKLKTLILSLCQLSRELLAIVVFCVCAKELPVKDADDLKKGQHLTRPGQSPLGFLFYRHHLLLKDIVVFPDKTAMLTLIHYTKCGRQIDIYETVEPYVPGDNVNVVQYGNPKYPPEAIIECAESSVNFRRKAKLDSYSLLFNNCESVITEFKVGSKLSLQTLFYFQIILMFVLCIVFCFTPWYITMFTFVVFFYLLKLLVHEFKYILQLR